jgi:hypothetical protein
MTPNPVPIAGRRVLFVMAADADYCRSCFNPTLQPVCFLDGYAP